jgi:hypothetical protein
MERIERARYHHQVVAEHSWSFSAGDTPSTLPSGLVAWHGTSARVKLQRKRHEKTLRAKVRAWVTLFGPKVVEFEFAVRLRSMAWLSPLVQCRVVAANVRSQFSPIFQACKYGDLKRIKLLLESGEASINDRNIIGDGLLWVSARVFFPSRPSNTLRALPLAPTEPAPGSPSWNCHLVHTSSAMSQSILTFDSLVCCSVPSGTPADPEQSGVDSRAVPPRLRLRS